RSRNSGWLRSRDNLSRVRCAAGLVVGIDMSSRPRLKHADAVCVHWRSRLLVAAPPVPDLVLFPKNFVVAAMVRHTRSYRVDFPSDLFSPRVSSLPLGADAGCPGAQISEGDAARPITASHLRARTQNWRSIRSRWRGRSKVAGLTRSPCRPG